MVVQCSQCGSRIVEPPGTDQFECPFCQAATLLVPTDGSAVEAKQLKRNRSVDLSKFTINLDGPVLEMWWGWDRLKGLAAIPLAAVIGWFGSIYLRPALATSGSIDWFALLFGAGTVVSALGLAYTGLALLLNSTTIAIRNHRLQTSHGPLPYYPRKRIPLATLQELLVHREVKKDSDGKVSVDYQLHARTELGRSVRLIIHQDSSEVPSAVKSVLDAHIRRLSETPAKVVEQSKRDGNRNTSPRRRKIVLICPHCAGLIPPPRKITSSKCRYCGRELRIEDEVWESLGLHPPRRRNIKHKPVTFVLRDEARTLTISAGWNRRGSRAVLTVAGIVLGIATTGFLLAFQSDNWSVVELARGGTIFVALASLLVGVKACAIAYLALCHMVNRTVVTIDASQVRVWNGPFPLQRNSQLPIEKIAQISIHRSRVPYVYRQTPCYRLDAISDYGGTLQLFFDQPELKGLETIERLIERRLNLADRIVEGEA